ncbi:hypothetical protein LAWI1_G007187 [Lachnellula willkommii]|uniref:BTB domain-containing protein n=1 Tax=Lachnellula willkommii TaxID=215461 RepID=A0A559M7S6_9HELO|nr:hypothetical protein LAWI1_G007187 [Lachnellula willkommii]
MASPPTFNLNAEILGNEIVTIHVGPKRKSFTIHKKLLCERSSYFQKAFAGGFKEGAEGVMYMDEEDAGTFDNLINWIYRDQLPSFPSKDFEDSVDGWCEFAGTIMAPLFFMAEKFCINELCNKIMDEFQDGDLRSGVAPDLEEITTAYADTHEKSKLRKYCAMMTIYTVAFMGENSKYRREIVEDGLLSELLKSTPDFATDFTILQCTYGFRFRAPKNTDPRRRTGSRSFGQCFFHTHSKGEVCHLGPEKKTKEKV